MLEAIDHLDADGGRGLRAPGGGARRPAVPGRVPRHARRPRPGRSRWPTSPAACTTSSCAATRTCSATSRPTTPTTSSPTGSEIKRERGEGPPSASRGLRRHPRRPARPAYALKVQRRAARPADGVRRRARVRPGPARRGAAAVRPGVDRRAEPSATLLFALVDAGRASGVDPETALRAAAVRFRAAVEAAELDGPAGSPRPASEPLDRRSSPVAALPRAGRAATANVSHTSPTGHTAPQ